jgi:hypothetical protein
MSEHHSIHHDPVSFYNDFKDLEKSVAEIREMARDAKHISIGVDGRNGLRGTLDLLARDVSKLAADVDFVKKAADDYIGLKSFFTKILVGSFMGIVTQVCFAVWYVSAQHTQQEALKELGWHLIESEDDLESESVL